MEVTSSDPYSCVFSSMDCDFLANIRTHYLANLFLKLKNLIYTIGVAIPDL